MPIADSNIVVYGSAVMPVDDTVTQIGGGIDTQKRMVFTDIDPAGPVEAISDGADTRTLTIYYLTAAGVLSSEAKALTGAVAVIFAATMNSILRMLLSATDAARTVTVRKSVAGATLGTLPVQTLELRRPHYNAIANAASGAQKDYFEKMFIKNLDGTLTLTGSTLAKTLDPQAVIDFALESVLNGTTDNGAGNNRLVAPAGFVFDSTAKAVANSGSLTAGAAQGFWTRCRLPAGKTPADTTFTMRLAGVSV